MRRAKSLRNGVHHANAVVWGPVYNRTRLRLLRSRLRDRSRHLRLLRDVHHELRDANRVRLRRQRVVVRRADVLEAEGRGSVRANVGAESKGVSQSES